MTIQLRSIAASAALSANTSMQSTMPVSVPSTSSSSSSSSLQSGGSRSAFQAPSQNRRQVKRPSAPTPSHPQQVSFFLILFFLIFRLFPFSLSSLFFVNSQILLSSGCCRHGSSSPCDCEEPADDAKPSSRTRTASSATVASIWWRDLYCGQQSWSVYFKGLWSSDFGQTKTHVILFKLLDRA